MGEPHENRPLSAEAEIVRVRDHFHGLNEKVGAIAAATANVARDVAIVTTDMAWMKDSQTDARATITDLKDTTAQHHEEIRDLLKPLVERVGTLSRIVFGAVGVILIIVVTALMAGIVKPGAVH